MASERGTEHYSSRIWWQEVVVSFKGMARGAGGTEAGRTTASAIAPGKRTLTEALGPTAPATARDRRALTKPWAPPRPGPAPPGPATPIAATPVLRLARAMVDE